MNRSSLLCPSFWRAKILLLLVLVASGLLLGARLFFHVGEWRGTKLALFSLGGLLGEPGGWGPPLMRDSTIGKDSGLKEGRNRGAEVGVPV